LNFNSENKSISSLKHTGQAILKSKGTYNTRVVETNKLGRQVDKITAEQNKPENGPIESIYGGDFDKSAKARVTQPAQKSGPTQHTKGSNELRSIKGSEENKSTVKFETIEPQGSTHNEPRYQLDEKYETLGSEDRPTLSVSATQTNLRSGADFDENPDKFHNTMLSLASKLQYKPPVGSVYGRDFKKHPIDPKPPKMNNDPWATFRADQPIDFGTTMRSDYKDWKQGPPQRNYIDLWKANTTNVPFGGRSSYKAEFINWGQNASAIEKPVAPRTIISELPFVGKSQYAETYTAPTNVTRVHKIDHNLFGKKSPLSPAIPFLGETTTGKTYQPYRVASLATLPKKEVFEKVEAYPGQFTSTYGSDFIKFDQKKKKEYTLKNKLTFL